MKIPRDWRSKTKVIHNPELMQAGESITIKGFYGDDDRQRVLSAAVEQVREQDGTAVTRATLDRMRRTKRHLAVLGWTLLAEDGQPLPFDEDTLLYGLPSDLCDWLDAEIEAAWDGLSRPRTAEEAKEEREERATFHGAGHAAPGRADAGRAPHERAGAADPGANGAAPANAPADERLPSPLLGHQRGPGTHP